MLDQQPRVPVLRGRFARLGPWAMTVSVRGRRGQATDPAAPQRPRFDGLLVARERHCASLREVLDGRRIWHVNSTPQGGGVAELLSTLLPYAADEGVDVRWLVVEGRDGFFDLTKRIHNMLHESDDVDPPLPEDRVTYEDGLVEERDEARRTIGRGDVVVLHDPQTAGLAADARRARRDGRLAVPCRHRCTGATRTRRLGPPTGRRRAPRTRRCSRAASYAWDGLRSRPHLGHGAVHRRRVGQEPPAGGGRRRRDAPPQRDLRRQTATAGAQTRPRSSSATASRVSITRRARIVDDLAVPSDASLVVQVSRWDRLKDPVGLMHAFVDTVLPTHDEAHLVLAGPETKGVDDDPESALVFGEVREDRTEAPTRSACTRASRRASRWTTIEENGADGQCAPAAG